jgi:hypothetical protein
MSLVDDVLALLGRRALNISMSFRQVGLTKKVGMQRGL